EPHHAVDLVEVAERRLGLGEQVHGAGARRLLSVVDRHAATELALGHELAVVAEAELTGEYEQPAATHESDVIGDGRRRRRQRDAELRKLALDCSGHDGLLPRSAADRHKFSPIARRGASGGVPVGRAQVARRRFGSYVDRTGERKATPAMIRARLAAAAAICSAVVLVPPAFGQAAGVVLAPHRAVYDLSLLRSQGKRPVAAVRGRILYDFSGSACAGYALNFRQVSELDTGEGKTALSDLRANTWEEGAAKRV